VQRIFKNIKRIAFLFVVLALIFVGILVATNYSEELAVHHVSLKCTAVNADTPQHLQKYIAINGETNYMQIRKDWINDQMLMNWLATTPTVNGLGRQHRLSESVEAYSWLGYGQVLSKDLEHSNKSLNRNNLLNRENLLYIYSEWLEENFSYSSTERKNRLNALPNPFRTTDETTNEISLRVESQCEIISRSDFEDMRMKKVEVIKSKQKI